MDDQDVLCNYQKGEEKIRKIHLQVLNIFLKVLGDSKYTKEEVKRMTRAVTKAYKMHKIRLSRIGVQIPELKEV